MMLYSQITKQTYFDTKFTVANDDYSTPITDITAKSLFKTSVITANIACILNGLEFFDRLTSEDARVCVDIILF